MKNFLLLIFVVITISCKSEKKSKETNPNKEDVVTTKTDVKVQYPKIENLSPDLVSIFNNGFSFTESIKIEEIGIISLDGNKYKIVYFLEESSDLSTIEKLNIGFRFYPNNPNLFEGEVDRKKKAKTIAIKGSAMKRMENSIVIVSDEFKIVPKDFKKVKIFFYDPENGIQGKTLSILNLNL